MQREFNVEKADVAAVRRYSLAKCSGGGGRLGGGGIEQKGKRTRGHGQQGGDCWQEGDIRGINGNGKLQ